MRVPDPCTVAEALALVPQHVHVWVGRPDGPAWSWTLYRRLPRPCGEPAAEALRRRHRLTGGEARVIVTRAGWRPDAAGRIVREPEPARGVSSPEPGGASARDRAPPGSPSRFGRADFVHQVIRV